MKPNSPDKEEGRGMIIGSEVKSVYQSSQVEKQNQIRDNLQTL